MNDSKAIAAFWKLFEQRASSLAECSSAEDPLYEELLEQLQRINPGLYFEFSTDSNPCEMIISADGDRDLFDLVDSLVGAAPPVSGWTVLALKPRLGFPETATWEGLTVPLAEVMFIPLERDGAEDLGLRLLVPGLEEDQIGDAHNALLRALDHGLGERGFAEAIQHTEVEILEEPTESHIPLLELEGYLQWRKERRRPA